MTEPTTSDHLKFVHLKWQSDGSHFVAHNLFPVLVGSSNSYMMYFGWELGPGTCEKVHYLSFWRRVPTQIHHCLQLHRLSHLCPSGSQWRISAWIKLKFWCKKVSFYVAQLLLVYSKASTVVERQRIPLHPVVHVSPRKGRFFVFISKMEFITHTTIRLSVTLQLRAGAYPSENSPHASR